MRPTETKPIANQQVKYYQFKYFLNHILTLSFKATYEEYDSIEFVGEDGNKPKCNSFKSTYPFDLHRRVCQNLLSIRSLYSAVAFDDAGNASITSICKHLHKLFYTTMGKPKLNNKVVYVCYVPP